MKKEDVYARMMHTPDDPVRAAQRSALRDGWKQLLPLHRALIDAASFDYEAAAGPINGPNHKLQLLQSDPFFSWLRPLTSIIVDLDSMSRTDFEAADVERMLARLEAHFGNTADPEFAARYLPVLQRDVEVAIAHAAIRQAMLRMAPPR